MSWQSLAVSAAGLQDPTSDAPVATYASDPACQAQINPRVMYAQVDLQRNVNGEGLTGDLVTDSAYAALNSDSYAANDVDVFFMNPRGLRTDWCYDEGAWSSLPATCAPGVWPDPPLLLNFGQMFTILPFGNSAAVGSMTGAKILEVRTRAPRCSRAPSSPRVCATSPGGRWHRLRPTRMTPASSTA